MHILLSKWTKFWNDAILICHFSNLNKTIISKFVYRFSQNIASNQKNWNLSLQAQAITNIFSLFKGLNESKLLSIRISYMSPKMLMKNEWKWISKFYSGKSCTLTLALIWNQLEFSSTYREKIISIPKIGYESTGTPT
jgi:hypothetical protein